jgi:hypothetical protein
VSLAERVKGATKILTLDIETAPSVVYTWGRFKQNIGLNQVIEDGRVLCVAAKWYGAKNVMFWSEHHDGRDAMIEGIHGALSEAEITIGYNHKNFDLKWLRQEFMLTGRKPTPPTKDVDLLAVVRQTARFESNKLDNVSRRLGIGSKIAHEGFDLWKACMAGDDAAWTRMKRYCVGDVKLTETLYDELRPWIKGHPHMGVNSSDEDITCNRCGSDDLERNGTWLANQIRYVRYQCTGCGGWVRGGRQARAAVARGI